MKTIQKVLFEKEAKTRTWANALTRPWVIKEGESDRKAKNLDEMQERDAIVV